MPEPDREALDRSFLGIGAGGAAAAGLAIAASAAAGAALLAAARPDWSAWRPATCMPAHCFCEAVRDGVVRQPANTLSSLAFVGAAVLVAMAVARGGSAASRHAAPLRRVSGYSIVLVLALLVIGFGSAFYHASLTFVGQVVDVLGMYLVATFVVLYAYRRVARLRGWVVVGAYLLANAVLVVLLVQLPEVRRHAFAVVLLAGLAAELHRRRSRPTVLDRRLLASAVGLLAIAFAIWALDLTRVVCDPHSPLQGHAAWHVLGAAAAWQLYRYYRSESPS